MHIKHKKGQLNFFYKIYSFEELLRTRSETDGRMGGISNLITPFLLAFPWQYPGLVDKNQFVEIITQLTDVMITPLHDLSFSNFSMAMLNSVKYSKFRLLTGALFRVITPIPTNTISTPVINIHLMKELNNTIVCVRRKDNSFQFPQLCALLKFLSFFIICPTHPALLNRTAYS